MDWLTRLEALADVERLLNKEKVELSLDDLKRLVESAKAFNKLFDVAEQEGMYIEPECIEGQLFLNLINDSPTSRQFSNWGSGSGSTFVEAAQELIASLEPESPNVIRPEHRLQIALDRRRSTINQK